MTIVPTLVIDIWVSGERSLALCCMFLLSYTMIYPFRKKYDMTVNQNYLSSSLNTSGYKKTLKEGALLFGLLSTSGFGVALNY